MCVSLNRLRTYYKKSYIMEKYKVFKVYNGGRRVTLFKNLSREEAMRVVNRYPKGNKKFLVCFERTYVLKQYMLK